MDKNLTKQFCALHLCRYCITFDGNVQYCSISRQSSVFTSRANRRWSKLPAQDIAL